MLVFMVLVGSASFTRITWFQWIGVTIFLNEFGKSTMREFGVILSFIFLAFALHPFYEACGGSLPFFDDYDISERLFWFGVCTMCYGLFHVFGFIISGLFHYAVYFVTRIWYIRKLHTPERIYPVE